MSTIPTAPATTTATVPAPVSAAPAWLVASALATSDVSRPTNGPAVSWREFLWRWHTEFGAEPVTARQAWECGRLGLHADPAGQRFPFPTGQPARLSPGIAPVRSLGRWLTGQVDVWHEDIVLRSAMMGTRRRRLYWTLPRAAGRPAAGGRPGPHHHRPGPGGRSVRNANQAPATGPDGLCTTFGVRVRWGAFVPAFPAAMQTKLTLGVPGLAPVTLLLTRGLTPQAPWGDLAVQACRLYHAGRGITDQRGDLGRLWTWLCQAGHRERFNQAFTATRTAPADPVTDPVTNPTRRADQPQPHPGS